MFFERHFAFERLVTNVTFQNASLMGKVDVMIKILLACIFFVANVTGKKSSNCLRHFELDSLAPGLICISKSTLLKDNQNKIFQKKCHHLR